MADLRQWRQTSPHLEKNRQSMTSECDDAAPPQPSLGPRTQPYADMQEKQHWK